MEDCDLLNESTTARWTSICCGFPPVPSPTYHLTTVLPPAAFGSNVSTATGGGVGGMVVWACADSAFEPVSASANPLAAHLSTVRLSIETSLRTSPRHRM